MDNTLASQRIVRSSLHDTLVSHLRDQIMRGDLRPGDKLPEQKLCERFGVSRTPMREAVKVLAAEGVLRLVINRGAIVAETAMQALDVDELRICPWAVREGLILHRFDRLMRDHDVVGDAYVGVGSVELLSREVNRVPGAALAVVLHEEATTPLAGLEVPATGEVLVVVGPEGGLSPEELAGLTAAGAVAVRLGAEVLRTSTAGVVAVGAMLARTPRWG